MPKIAGFLVLFMPNWMRKSFFYAEILNTDCTLNSMKNSIKSKTCNMPKMAQNGPKWPKFGRNTFYFLYFMTENVLTLCKTWYWPPRKSFQKIRNFEPVQNGPIWPKMAKIRHFWHVQNFGFLWNFFWVMSITLHIKLRHFQS